MISLKINDSDFNHIFTILSNSINHCSYETLKVLQKLVKQLPNDTSLLENDIERKKNEIISESYKKFKHLFDSELKNE